MGDFNYTNEPLNQSSDRYRACKNAENFDCKHKNFMTRDRRSVFCTKKCADTYHNNKKVKIANSKLNGKDANLKILQSLTCSKNSITINQHILESYGFDFEKYDQKANVSSTNVGLLFGNFILQRSLNNKNEVIIIKN
jgi:hypothetical protein